MAARPRKLYQKAACRGSSNLRSDMCRKECVFGVRAASCWTPDAQGWVRVGPVSHCDKLTTSMLCPKMSPMMQVSHGASQLLTASKSSSEAVPKFWKATRGNTRVTAAAARVVWKCHDSRCSLPCSCEFRTSNRTVKLQARQANEVLGDAFCTHGRFRDDQCRRPRVLGVKLSREASSSSTPGLALATGSRHVVVMGAFVALRTL